MALRSLLFQSVNLMKMYFFIEKAIDFQISVARKAVFALSCLVRGFPYGQQILAQNGGLEVLRKVFDKGDFQVLPLQLKVS